MPDLDGYAVARAVRQIPAVRPALLIALTGHSLPEEQREAREAGFDVFLSKPTDPERLRRLVKLVQENQQAAG